MPAQREYASLFLVAAQKLAHKGLRHPVFIAQHIRDIGQRRACEGEFPVQDRAHLSLVYKNIDPLEVRVGQHRRSWKRVEIAMLRFDKVPEALAKLWPQALLSWPRG